MTDDDKKLPKGDENNNVKGSVGTGVKRRDLLQGIGAGGLAAGVGGFTYLKGLDLSKLRAQAQEGGPVKVGFIEDESGNLAVYGLQKLHAAQLAVAEINAGKTLKGAPNIGAGVLGAMGQVAANPPVISKEGTGLDVVDDEWINGAEVKTAIAIIEGNAIDKEGHSAIPELTLNA